MSTREKIEGFFEEIGFLEDPNYDDAIIGVASGKTLPGDVVAYDLMKCIEILMSRGATREDAEEFFYYNTADAYLGDFTPVFIDTRFAE